MVLSALCPTSFNVRPAGTTPTEDNMLSPMAQAILHAEKLRMEKERCEKKRRDEEILQEEWDAWERQEMMFRRSLDRYDNAPTYNDSDPTYKPWRGCHMQD